MSHLKPVECPSCRKQFEVAAEYIGQYGRCDSCNHKFQLQEVVRAAPVAPQPMAKKKSKAPLALVAVGLIALSGVGAYKLWGTNSTNSDIDSDPVNAANSQDSPELKHSRNKASSQTKQHSPQEASVVKKSLIAPESKAPSIAMPYKNGEADWSKVAYPNPMGVIALLENLGKMQGKGIKNHPFSHFSNWNSEVATIEWQVAIPQAGEYEVRYNGSCGENNPNNKLEIQCDGQTISTVIRSTGDWKKYEQRAVGKIKFSKAGKFTLTAKGNPIQSDTHLMDLRNLSLHPVKAKRYFDFTTNDWTTEVPEIYRNNHTFKIGPRPYNANMKRKGYVIITTNNLKNNLKELNNFIAQKEKMGFKVQVITEDHFGESVGEEACKNIRKWLHENHEKQGILYALMLGNPHPQEGAIPMSLEMGAPTDIVYADCNLPQGVDGDWDVLVGRIPYFGEESEDGKFADVDAILSKTIDYENEKSIHYRYSFGLDGTSWIMNSAMLEAAGIHYIPREPNVGSYLRPNEKSLPYNNTTFLKNHVVGYQRTGGHANANFIEGGLSRGSIRDQLQDRPQVVHEYGGCSCATPEYSCNLAYVHLRYSAISVLGATRSIATLGGNSRPYLSHFKSNILQWGMSVGQAHWRHRCEDAKTRGNRYQGGNIMFVLLGDPSIRPFPNSLKSSYPALVRPVWHRTEKVYSVDEVKGNVYEFDIENNTSAPLYWSASAQVEWLTLSLTTGKSETEGEVATIKATINDKVTKLKNGEHWGTINITSNGHEQIRHILLIVEDESIYQVALEENSFNPATANKSIPVSNERVPGVHSISFGATVKWENSDQSAPIFVDRKGRNILFYDANAKKLKLSLLMNAMAGSVSWIEPSGIERHLDSSFHPQTGQWYHITVSVDRKAQKVSLYIDGREVENISLDPRLVHDIHAVNVPKQLNAEVKNLYYTNYPFSSKQALSFHKAGGEPILLSPEADAHVNNNDVKLRFLTGGTDIEKYQIRLASNEGSLTSATPLETATGEVSVGDLKELSQYACRIDRILKDGSVIQGKIQHFNTTKSLIHNSDLAERHQHWVAPIGTSLPKATSEKGGNEFWFIEPNQACQQITSEKVVAGKLYTLSATPTPRDRGQILAKILIKDGDSEKVVSESLITVEDPRKNKIYYLGTKQDAGKTLAVQLIRHEHNMGLGSIEFYASTGNLPNQAPIVDSAVTNKVYQYKVKDNLAVYDIFKQISDPDGDKFTITKISGPNWVGVRGFGSLFSPFGPPETEVGEHEMKLEATDTKGNSKQFTIKISVSK